MYFLENLPNKYDIQTLYEPIDWIFNELNIPDNINIVFEFATLDKNINGTVYDEDFEPEDTERWFIVELSKSLKKDDLFSVILHEMIHVDQIISGKLQYKNCIPYWEGEKQEGLSYFKRPWEIDAFIREADILNKYEYSSLHS